MTISRVALERWPDWLRVWLDYATEQEGTLDGALKRMREEFTSRIPTKFQIAPWPWTIKSTEWRGNMLDRGRFEVYSVVHIDRPDAPGEREVVTITVSPATSDPAGDLRMLVTMTPRGTERVRRAGLQPKILLDMFDGVAVSAWKDFAVSAGARGNPRASRRNPQTVWVIGNAPRRLRQHGVNDVFALLSSEELVWFDRAADRDGAELHIWEAKEFGGDPDREVFAQIRWPCTRPADGVPKDAANAFGRFGWRVQNYACIVSRFLPLPSALPEIRKYHGLPPRQNPGAATKAPPVLVVHPPAARILRSRRRTVRNLLSPEEQVWADQAIELGAQLQVFLVPKPYDYSGDALLLQVEFPYPSMAPQHEIGRLLLEREAHLRRLTTIGRPPGSPSWSVRTQSGMASRVLLLPQPARRVRASKSAGVTVLEPGDWIVAGSGEDADYGRVDADEQGRLTVAWYASMTRTPPPGGRIARYSTRAAAEAAFKAAVSAE